jgi:hypothetical protein
MKADIHFFIISRSVLLRMSNFLNNFVDKLKQVFKAKIFFRKFCLYEIIRKKNSVDTDSP